MLFDHPAAVAGLGCRQRDFSVGRTREGRKCRTQGQKCAGARLAQCTLGRRPSALQRHVQPPPPEIGQPKRHAARVLGLPLGTDKSRLLQPAHHSADVPLVEAKLAREQARSGGAAGDPVQEPDLGKRQPARFRAMADMRRDIFKRQRQTCEVTGGVGFVCHDPMGPKPR